MDGDADFVFGPVASGRRTLARERRRARGLWLEVDPLPPRPGGRLQVTVHLGTRVHAGQVALRYTLDGSAPVEDAARLPLRPAGTAWSGLAWGYGQRWEGVLELPRRGGLRLQAEADGQRTPVLSWSLEGLDPPAWARSMVLYHILVDRFASHLGPLAGEGELRGGTLRGIEEKLPYLADLGVTALWLSPIWESDSHHGYDVRDYHSVAARLGGSQDLRRLVEAAHRRGLRVLLDFVAGHCSHRHPFFLQARRDPRSPYRRWFTFTRWPDRYRCFFGVQTLPSWNLDHPPARDYMIERAVEWVRDYGVDGYRLDYALGPSLEFWWAFRRAVKGVNPEALLVGEVVEEAPVVAAYAGRLDGCLDFLLLDQMRRAFLYGEDLRSLASFLERHQRFMPTPFLRPAFLDNHDMNRFLWSAGGDRRRLRQAAFFLYAQPQPVVLYYGTEVGLSQEEDVRQEGWAHHHHARLPMLWGQDQDAGLLDFFRRLNRLRPLLAGQPWQVLQARERLLVWGIGEHVAAVNLGAETEPEPVEARGEALLQEGYRDGRLEPGGFVLWRAG